MSSNPAFLSDPSSQYSAWLASPPSGDEVVISGMSGRFPSSHSVQEYMNNLYAKKEMITKNDARWMANHPETPPRSGRLLEINKYDAGYFGVHYRQAMAMDPMVRLVMETVIEAIMDAGFNPSEMEGTKTGVFMSTSWSDYESETYNNVKEERNNFIATGTFRSFFSHRMSYYLKLKGPACNVDSACSSSLNAIDTAFKAIRSGQCDNAIVAGTNMLLHPGTSIQFYRLGVLSPEAVCRVFDQDANGYVRGETVASVFLQKAKNSRRIYAQVINAKANSDGFKPEGITFPSMKAQKILMTELYDESRVNLSEVGFIEAHGTGTQVGDPQEVEAIDCAIAQKRSEQLLIGSVKCTVGHTEPASGICSVIKVLLAMESGLISPNINLKQVRKSLTGIQEGRMKVVTELTKLRPDNAIVGVNNFGFGGNNAHLILRRFKKNKINRGKPDDDIPRIVCVSGRTKKAVLDLLDEIINKPLDSEYVALLHQIFKISFKNHFYRGYAILSKRNPIKTSVHFERQSSPLYVVFGSFVNNFNILAMYLSGFPGLRNIILRIDEILTKKGKPTIEAHSNNDEDRILGSICVQLAFVDILKHLEIYPTALYSDSYSKLVGAYYYGVVDLEEAITEATKLSQLDNEVKPQFQIMSKNSTIVNLDTISKNAFILNVSDSHIKKEDVLLVENNSVKFLDTLGRMFERGQVIQLQKLYTKPQFPVSRGTSMISSSLKWDHRKIWYTYNFTGFQQSNAEQKEFLISYFDEEYKYIKGHVIDGRMLFPATGYLYLVWQTCTLTRQLLPTDTPVVFKNCKFIRGVTFPKGGNTNLFVNVQKGTGYFEILEKDLIVVTGYIEMCSSVQQEEINFDPLPFDKNDQSNILEHDEIYRELYLRGYNYSGVFKGIEKCTSDASAGLIKWENNWVSFMDKMLQMIILQTDTKLLFVPTCIKKLIVDPAKHEKIVKDLPDTEPLIPVYVYKKSNLIRSGGIEITGLQAKSISKKKQRLEPVVEKSEFIPNHSQLELNEAVRVNTQIITEINLQFQFKAVEVIDDITKPDSTPLLPFVCYALDDVPVIIPDLTISSKTPVEEVPGIKIENVILTSDSNLTLLIGTKILSRLSSQKQALSSLAKNGFLLTREEIDFVPETINDLTILTEFTTSNEKLILLQKQQKFVAFSSIQVSSKKYDWVPKLQNLIKTEPAVLIYAKNEEPEGILGLANCLRREPNGSKVKCLFMMDEAPEFDPNHSFYLNQLTKGFAINVFRNGTWGTYRHLRLEELAKVESEYYYANITNRGDMSSLNWLQTELNEKTPLNNDQILVYPYYASVNFKDIMAASGRVNVEIFAESRLEQECLLGIEFSGRDVKGRRVFGMCGSRAIASHVLGNTDFLWEIPESWTLEEAATVPVVYCTVLYALTMVTQLKPNSSILIHSATGGIGLAALNICLYYKCNIFVTVGTQEKREYLRKHYPQIHESYIGNSRDTSFEDMIKTQTKGRGVDVVLNSLSDDKLKASIRCLTRGGKFVEIGKFDLANDTSLSLLFMEKEASYHGIMLDRVFVNAGDTKSKLANVLRKGISLGFVRPLPRVVFSKEKIQASYRYMMTGKHIGKVLIKIRDEEENKVVVPRNMSFKVHPSFNCDELSSYVIIGGLGGVGLELADWLVLRKAKKIVLVSRTGVQSGYQMQKLRIWRSYGVDVHVLTNDVTTNQGCLDLIKEATQLGPIDGIFNLAVVLKDAFFEDQTSETFQAVQAPKAQTTIFLDEITRKLCPKLRYFVIFSSVSCGRGNAGQTNYGMANSVMERICEKRKRDGFPAVAIQWGAIGDVGLVAKMQKENKELIIGGTLQQKISSCLQVLETLLKQPHPIVSCMVVAEKHQKNYGSMSAVETVAFVLGIKHKAVSYHAPLIELGMDSMTGTEIMQLLEKDFEIYITLREIRTLTFAKLEELEADKNKNNTDKTQLGSNVLIQFFPDSSTSGRPVIRITSQLQENEKGPTLFLLPGIEGVFTGFESLVKSLKAHVFGVHYNYDKPQDTIQKTAENVLQHLHGTLSKNVPFFFMCYSYGVSVGLEIVAQLEKAGFNGQLLLIEGSPTYLKATAKSIIPENTEAEIQTGIICHILNIILPFDVVVQHKDKLLKCETFEDRIELASKLIPSEIQNRQKLKIQGVIILYKRFMSVLNYEFSHNKIKSQVYLVKAKYPIVIEEDDYQLSKICEKPINAITLNGDHMTILNQAELVEHVNKVLANCD